MNEDELQAFLDRPLTAVISTLSPSGAVHGIPAWYSFDDGVFVIWTDANRRWVRNLHHSVKVSVVVAEHEMPFGAVIVHGTATVATDEPGTDEAIHRIVERYVPPDGIEAYIQSWASLRTIVRITPTLIRSWASGY